MPTHRNKKKKASSTTRQVLQVLAFVVLMALSAQMSIDFGGLSPFTLQTLVLGLFYFFLPRRIRLISILLYLSLGAAGLPIFSEWRSGLTYINSSSLGFFVGFIAATFIEPKNTNTLIDLLSYFLLIHVSILIFGALGYLMKLDHWSAIPSTLMYLVPGLVIKSITGSLLSYGLKSRL